MSDYFVMCQACSSVAWMGLAVVASVGAQAYIMGLEAVPPMRSRGKIWVCYSKGSLFQKFIIPINPNRIMELSFPQPS